MGRTKSACSVRNDDAGQPMTGDRQECLSDRESLRPKALSYGG
jgi:hypothetical protein